LKLGFLALFKSDAAKHGKLHFLIIVNRESNMTPRQFVLAAAAIATASITCANAQSVLVEKNVSMKMVQMIIDGAIEQCIKDGYKVSVVIVDNAGTVRGSLRGDGTSPATMEFARKKAYTARVRNQTSLEFMTLTDSPANAGLRQIPDVVAIGGGVPIKIAGVSIGAVGVSGAPGGEKDEICAMAGINKVAEYLK
jgi:uncharacterized protein GlcG (DUF336 family)